MNHGRVAAAAALTTVALGAARAGVELAGERAIDALRSGDAALAVGTTGETVTLYVSVLEALGPLMTVGLALGLGVHLGRRVDVRSAHRDLLTAVGAGSGAVAAVGGLATFVAAGPLRAYGVLFGAVTAFRVLATLTLPLVVGTLAGAALVAFERDDDGGAVAEAGRKTSPGERDVERAADRSADHAGAD